jgi:hypothetical protein
MNADGETVGYFSDYGAEMATRREWGRSHGASSLCRSYEVAIAPLELEDVKPGDGDRVDYLFKDFPSIALIGGLVADWISCGAASVEVQHFLINKYRRPGCSARDSDLGGPVDAAGVLYILKIKAPK